MQGTVPRLRRIPDGGTVEPAATVIGHGDRCAVMRAASRTEGYLIKPILIPATLIKSMELSPEVVVDRPTLDRFVMRSEHREDLIEAEETFNRSRVRAVFHVYERSVDVLHPELSGNTDALEARLEDVAQPSAAEGAYHACRADAPIAD